MKIHISLSPVLSSSKCYGKPTETVLNLPLLREGEKWMEQTVLWGEGKYIHEMIYWKEQYNKGTIRNKTIVESKENGIGKNPKHRETQDL